MQHRGSNSGIILLKADTLPIEPWRPEKTHAMQIASFFFLRID